MVIVHTVQKGLLSMPHDRLNNKLFEQSTLLARGESKTHSPKVE
jgi:hypothetical protein